MLWQTWIFVINIRSLLVVARTTWSGYGAVSHHHAEWPWGGFYWILVTIKYPTPFKQLSKLSLWCTESFLPISSCKVCLITYTQCATKNNLTLHCSGYHLIIIICGSCKLMRSDTRKKVGSQRVFLCSLGTKFSLVSLHSSI